MRDDYQPYFDELNAGVLTLGGVCLSESELFAEFSMPSGWSLAFDCERFYGPSWTIYLINPERSLKLVLPFLMLTFAEFRGRFYGPPTIANQVNFLREEWSRIIGDYESYVDDYGKVELRFK